MATLLTELIVKPLLGRPAPFARLEETLIYFLVWGLGFGVIGWVKNVYLPQLNVKD